MATTKLLFSAPRLSRYHISLYPKPLSVKIMSSNHHQIIIEHIVLFRAKPESDPSKLESMVSNLNGLKSLDQVLHISAGALARTRSSPFPPFTHMLHSRYKSKDDLTAYSAHPRHVSVVEDHVKPNVDDIMAVDWVSVGLSGPTQIRPGKGIRVNLLKLKDGLGESVRDEILGVIGGIKGNFEGVVEEISFGENFSMGRAKGFSIGSIAVVDGKEGLEALDSDSEGVKVEKEKVKGFIESVIVLDYVVPHAQNASL